MTTFTLMSGQTLAGGSLSPVAVSGNPTRATYTMTLTGPVTNYAGATVLGSLDGAVYVPLVSLAVGPGGPNTVTQDLGEAGNFVSYDAQLDYIIPGVGAAVTITMTV